MAVGYWLRKRGIFSVEHARAINRFVFFVATPLLLFSILSRASVDAIDLVALGIYLLAELVLYAAVTILLNRVFKRDLAESVLLGMSAVFVNHVFFVLPIAERLYGSVATQPIASIILIDAVVLFCGTVLLIDYLKSDRGSAIATVLSFFKNPFLLSSLIGIAASGFQEIIPSGIFTFANFVGGSAAPASLFALGVVLASSRIQSIGFTTWFVVSAKILIHPALFFGLSAVVTAATLTNNPMLLVAAGPCGAMPFVIALQYEIKTDAIAKAMLISTLLSLISLAALTA